MINKRQQRIRRKKRMMLKTRGTQERPRMSVFRSNLSIYAQLIDDTKKVTILGVCEKHLNSNEKQKVGKAKEMGILLAKKAIEKKIKSVVLDRSGYAYAGRVKAFAEGAREGGLVF